MLTTTPLSLPATRQNDVPLTLVLGKGGVGKTTVATALTALAVERGLRARRVELGSASSVHKLDDDALVLDPDQALEDAATPVFGSRALARAALGNAAFSRLLEVLPGLREYAMLLSAVDLTRALGGGAYDRVIVDMPATGHGVSWLAAAERFARLVPRGRSREQADRLDSTLRDPTKTAFVVVSLAEPLVLSETLELRGELRAHLGRDADRLVVNRMPSAPPTCAANEARAEARSPARSQAQATALLKLASWLDARSEPQRVASDASRGIPSTWLGESVGKPDLRAICRALSAFEGSP